MNIGDMLFGRPNAPDPVVPQQKSNDDAIRRALQNTNPNRGRNFVTIDPTSGLSLYDREVQGSTGLSIPTNK